MKNPQRWLLAVAPVAVVAGLLIFLLVNRSGVFSPIETSGVEGESRQPFLVAVEQKPTVIIESKPIAIPVSVLPTPAVSDRPVCQFHGHAPDPPTASLLDKFVFSEPRVVLTNTGSINVAGWLPDSQRILLARMPNPKVSNEYAIETFNVRTGERVGYGTSTEVSGISPVWLPRDRGVAYLKDADSAPNDLLQLQVHISSGDTEPAKIVAERVGWNLSLTSDQEVAYYDLTRPGRLQLWDQTTKRSKASNMDLSPWLAQDFLESYPLGPLSTWQPNSPQVFFRIPFLNGIFLLGYRSNGTVCEVPIPGTSSEVPFYIIEAVWSPNGRYLAMIIGQEGARWGAVTYRNLMILDTVSGDWNQPVSDIWLVWDLAWDSNSRHLLVLGDQDIEGTVRQRLHLVDTFTNKARLMLPDQLFGRGSDTGSSQMNWAKNGKEIALVCPFVPEGEDAMIENRLCLINVDIDPK